MSKAWNKNILIERISSLLSKKEQYTIDKQPVITSTRSVCTMFVNFLNKIFKVLKVLCWRYKGQKISDLKENKRLIKIRGRISVSYVVYYEANLD